MPTKRYIADLKDVKLSKLRGSEVKKPKQFRPILSARKFIRFVLVMSIENDDPDESLLGHRMANV